MKTIDSQKMTVMAVVSMLTLALGATADTATSWDVSTISSGTGWKVIDSGTAVTVQFPEKTSPIALPYTSSLLVGGSSPSTAFTGDFSKYTGIRFKITGDGSQPEFVQVRFYRKVGWGTRRWLFNNLPVSTNAGEWTINLIPLSYEKGWTTCYDFSNYRNPDPAYWFKEDLKNVDMLMVTIRPGSHAAQSYSIDQFQLLGEGGPTEPASLTPLEAYFGVNNVSELTDEQKEQDSDGDGMSDLNEILAGMDPQDASSVFSAASVKSGNGNLVKWQGVLGSKYAVWRSTDLAGGFELIATDISADKTGIISYEDPDPVAGKANFYKVVKY